MVWKFIAIGLLAGLSSGFFGLGGGFIMVPLLISWVGVDQRLASAVSLIVIIPTAVIAGTLYGVEGQVDWLSAGLMASGALLGGPLGAWLLGRVSLTFLKWLLVSGLLVGTIRLLLEPPSREGAVPLGIWPIIVLVLLGVMMGLLAGLLGVGGGIIAVPVLIGFLGTGDLLAKGSSLIAIIPAAVVTALRHRHHGLHGNKQVGVLIPSSLAGVAVGTELAFTVPTDISGQLLAALMLFVSVRMAQRPTT